jgi:hypothetical protein
MYDEYLFEMKSFSGKETIEKLAWLWDEPGSRTL